MLTVRQILMDARVKDARIVSTKPSAEPMRRIPEPISLRENALRTLYAHRVTRIILNIIHLDESVHTGVYKIVKSGTQFGLVKCRIYD